MFGTERMGTPAVLRMMGAQLPQLAAFNGEKLISGAPRERWPKTLKATVKVIMLMN